MELEEILSPTAYKLVQKKIENQKRYKTDSNSGYTMPFVFKFSDTGSIDHTVKPPKEIGRNYSFEPIFRIYDPWRKSGSKTINLPNVTGVEPKTTNDNMGNTITIDVPSHSRIQFEGGILEVPVDNEWLVAIAVLADNNMSKPQEMKNKNAVVSPNHQWVEDTASLYTGVEVKPVNDILLRNTALNFAKEYTFETKRQVLAEAFKKDSEKYKAYNPEGKASEAIDNDLFIFADKYPREFLHLNVTDDTKVDLLILDLKARGIVLHDAENAKFIEKRGDKEEKLFTYNKVSNTEHPDVLLKKFLTDVKNEKKREWLEKLVKPMKHPYILEEEEVAPKAEKELVLS